MSGANYEDCPGCDRKALYMGEEDVPDGIEVWHAGCRAEAQARAVAAERASFRAAIEAVHRPVPVYEIAAHGHADARPVLLCGHPASALEDDRHDLSGDGDWICLDQLARTSCEGCRDEDGEMSDFEACATRAAMARVLAGEDTPS